MNKPTDPDTRKLAIDRFSLYYAQSGNGDPLILLHGGGTWHYTYRHNLGTLSRHFRVIAPDMPGHGFTRPVDRVRRYNMATIIKTLRGLMDRLGIEKADLLGHSWGGGWAIHFAKAFPDRVRRLVLIDSSGLNPRERPEWELLKLPVIGRILARMVTRNSVRKGLKAAFHDSAHVTPEMVEAVYTPLTIPSVRFAQHSFSRHLDWTRTETILPQLRLPVLVLWGREDRYIPVAYGSKMADLLPDSRLVIIDGCGHSAHEEKPETVNRCILDFLLRNPG